MDEDYDVPAKRMAGFELKKNECYAIPCTFKETVNKIAITTAPKEIGSTKKMLVCAYVLMVVIVIGACACIIGAYVEITKLRSEVASLQQTSSDATSSPLTECNKNISHFVNATCADLSALELHLENSIEELAQASDQAVQNIIHLLTTFSSCAEVLQQIPSSPSGYYYVRSSNGDSAVRVYCDMTRSCGNITGGWMKVAELDMTDNTTQCPSGLRLNTTTPRSCRINNINNGSCSSDTFLTFGIRYSQVCGQVIAYQVGSTDAFIRLFNSTSIDSNYVDGVSLTHGRTPRQHIWTFAAAVDEVTTRFLGSTCFCSNTAVVSLVPPPPFVGNDYFCDTAAAASFQFGVVYSDDPLWDGAGCGSNNTCCSFNNPPWFYKQLPKSTTDDIEMRVCRDQESENEDIAIEKLNIYIQ